MNTEPVTEEPPKLADLNEALLDGETLARLFRDLEVCTEIIEVIPRAARHQAVAATASMTLGEARERLAAGELSGIQVRYGYEGAEWWDTLIRTPQGTRIVRIRHEFDRG